MDAPTPQRGPKGVGSIGVLLSVILLGTAVWLGVHETSKPVSWGGPGSQSTQAPGVTRRWPECKTLTWSYLPEGEVSPATRPAVEEAVALLSTSTGLALSEAPLGTEADIVIRWSGEPDGKRLGIAAVSFRPTPETIGTAEVTLYGPTVEKWLQDASSGAEVRSLSALVFHELGHTVGVGHSDEKGSVFAPQTAVHWNGKLTYADAAALRSANPGCP